MYKGEIPFDEEGNQLHYPETWSHKSIIWKDNYQFFAKLKFIDYCRGRSAAYFIVEDEKGKNEQ